MKQSFPSVVTADGTVKICFSDSEASESLEVACVVDLTDFGDVLGIEVLAWQRQLSGGKIVAPSVSENVRWSYDEEIDALSIHLREGYSQVQRPATCVVNLDSSKRVVCLEFPIPYPTR
jgi:hypothetical protein